MRGMDPDIVQWLIEKLGIRMKPTVAKHIISPTLFVRSWRELLTSSNPAPVAQMFLASLDKLALESHVMQVWLGQNPLYRDPPPTLY